MHASHVAATYRKGKRLGGSPKLQTKASDPAGIIRKKRNSGAKSLGPAGWVPLSPADDSHDASCWVLGRRGEVDGDIRSYDTAIVSGSLFARAVAATRLDVGEHLPRRMDSLFLHPDTMRLCGVAIAQPVAVRGVDRSSVAICKPWPFKKLNLDAVALSPLVLRSVVASWEGEEGGERVEVWRVPSPSLLAPASEVHLLPRSSVDSTVLNDSFKNYTRSLLDGLYVCEGNTVSVPFCHEELEFSVGTVIPVGRVPEPNSGSRLSLSTSSRNVTTLLEDTLHLNLSGLCLGGGGGGGGGRGGERSPSPSSPFMRTSVCHLNVVTSTPGMEVDRGSPAHSGTESGHSENLEPNLGEESAVSLDQKLQGLGLDGREGVSEREDGPTVEVLVCKMTAKTKIVFVEDKCHGEGRGEVAMRDVGGLSKQKQLLSELVLYPLQHPTTTDGIQFPNGILLHGLSGVGKSLLSCALSSETSATCLSLSHSDSISSEGLAKRFQSLFREARDRCPCLILIDDLHLLCSSPASSDPVKVSSITGTLAACLDTLHAAPPPRHVVVVATTNQIEGIDSSLRRPGRFDREIEFPVPTSSERREILGVLLRGVAHCLKGEELVGVADSAHGHTGSDLRAVCMQAQHKALHRHLEGLRQSEGEGGGVVVRGEDVRGALREVRPSAMREVTVEVPKVLWSDIGGQEEVKRRLREAVEWPLQHPQAFSRLGIDPPKGVLLFGPPGCSKTMIARALATESGLNFISVKGPELFSKWVGDSERAVRQVFRRARAAAPAIIFFDEIDALAVQRNSGSSSVADRVLAQLLTEMDGVERLKDVLIVAATNRPDMIDKALLRPGRIDRMIYVPLPSDATRKEIFQINFRSTPVAGDVCLDQLVLLTHGFSGAEVVALCQEAALRALHEDIATETVSLRHFQHALGTITPQTQASTIAEYERYCKMLR